MDPKNPQHPFPQALVDAARDPARQDQTVAVEGTAFRLQFDPEPGVDMRVEAVEAPDHTRNTLFHATDERPASYPPELPFLPGLATSVFVFPGGADAGASIMWNVPDVEGALAELRAQCAADGWAEEAEGGLDFLPGLRMLNFERADGSQRVLHVTSSGGGTMISLVQSRD
ncbi:MAG TPA: hypothetical protein VLK84_15105 [Longimicrobium sp.]|nr:hypothetical protein [Longimicrobium sp.]